MSHFNISASKLSGSIHPIISLSIYLITHFFDLILRLLATKFTTPPDERW